MEVNFIRAQKFEQKVWNGAQTFENAQKLDLLLKNTLIDLTGQFLLLTSNTAVLSSEVLLSSRVIATVSNQGLRMANDRVRIVCVSDTHNDDLTGQVPDGDILLHAGDMTDDGTYDELEIALGWIRKLPHKLKLIIPGMKVLPLLCVKLLQSIIQP